MIESTVPQKHRQHGQPYFNKKTVKDSTILTKIPSNSGKYRSSICKITPFHIKVRKREDISSNIISDLPWGILDLRLFKNY